MGSTASLRTRPRTAGTWGEGSGGRTPYLPVLEARYVAVVRFALWFESSDSYTSGHCERVAAYASEVASALGLDPVQIASVRLGAYLHDVGKIRVPQEILNKPGRLTIDEFDVMKMHPVWGLEMLEGVALPRDVRATIRWHHEKCDGSGYPDGLRGDQIPLHASVIGIADVYDALTSARSYRPGMPSREALAMMQARRGWWRPEVYGAFRKAASAPTADSTITAALIGGRHSLGDSAAELAAAGMVTA